MTICEVIIQPYESLTKHLNMLEFTDYEFHCGWRNLVIEGSSFG